MSPSLEAVHPNDGAPKTGVALVALDRDLLELVGADRQRFLHGLVTCDVKGLAAGDGRYGFFTSGQGKVLCDFVLLASADRLHLDLPAGLGAEMAAHLQKYVIADRVEIRSVPDRTAIALLGSRLDAGLDSILPELGALPASDWGHGEVEVEGVTVELGRHPRLGAPAAVAWVETASAERLRGAWIARGARPIDGEDLEALRVEAGIPRFGVDFGADNFPQETGQEEAAVSYTKGCYLGQEVVARIHYRGGVQRSLRGVRFERDIPPSGAVLEHEGREAGRVGSTTRSPRCGSIGLAMVHKRASAAGTRLSLPDGSAAEVVDLPFL